MKKIGLGFILACCSTLAHANGVEAECVAASADWNSTGDTAAQCKCIAEAVAGNDALISEFMAFRSNYSNDAEAYAGASDAAKSVMDQCAVEI